MITAYSISRICGSGMMGRGVGGIGGQGWRKKENGRKFEKEGMEKKERMWGKGKRGKHGWKGTLADKFIEEGEYI